MKNINFGRQNNAVNKKQSQINNKQTPEGFFNKEQPPDGQKNGFRKQKKVVKN